MIQRNKKHVYALILASLLVISGLLFFMKDTNPPVMDELDQPTIADHALTYSTNGHLTLYDMNQGVDIDSFDLNSLSDIKEEVVLEPEREPSPIIETAPVDEKEAALTYKDFEMIEVIIKKGDYAWKIQKELTPNRDIGQMVAFVSKANGNKKLHPIYPGEKIYFLREKRSETKANSSSKEASDKEVTPMKEFVNAKSLERTKKKVIASPSYLFFKDINETVLYGYSNFSKEVYKITEEKGKINVEVIAKYSSLGKAYDFMVAGGKVFLSEQEQSKVQVFNIRTPDQVQTIELDGHPSNWLLRKEELFYTYRDRLGKYNLSTNEKSNILVGDESLDLFNYKEKLYILNSFGKKTMNSLLMQINPSDLHVDNILELKSKTTAIVSKGQDDLFLVGIDKSQSNSPKEMSESKIHLIKENSLSLENSNWSIPFTEEAITYNSHLYILRDKSLSVYTLNSTEPIKTVELEGDYFTVFP
ncbi:hypothetical protein NDS46_31280 (plasmid) [Paenibacillus thiaminolyticus]|uniref:hypothetical protein n=1 Tax=Paenibacillus thiaminolyticus TaxID=49283 RepID=UPI00232D05D8|nr:hypothetical protein [Paenibacillus thiaminolyticus]WCF11441.1 hypothetical protein NDS46_31280 [Paenibacillus thiaminolyticus]